VVVIPVALGHMLLVALLVVVLVVQARILELVLAHALLVVVGLTRPPVRQVVPNVIQDSTRILVLAHAQVFRLVTLVLLVALLPILLALEGSFRLEAQPLVVHVALVRFLVMLLLHVLIALLARFQPQTRLPVLASRLGILIPIVVHRLTRYVHPVPTPQGVQTPAPMFLQGPGVLFPVHQLTQVVPLEPFRQAGRLHV
jgi:hypothetical protein